MEDKREAKSERRRPWNYGKRKPEPDQDGLLWCSCLLCGTPRYH